MTVDQFNNIPFLNIIQNELVDAIYLIDPDTSNILWVNAAGYHSLLMDKEEVLNHSVLSLQKDVIGFEQWKSIAGVIKEQKKFTFMGRHLRKDGTDFPVEVITSYFTHENQEYFLSVARDISNRRAIEAGAQGREQQVWFALNACSDGLWDWEIQTGNVYFSPQMKRMLGYGPDEMLPHLDTWKENVHPEDMPHVIQALQEHIQGKRERYEAVYRLKNRNGHYLWAHDLGTISQHNEKGEPIRITGMVKDITDYKLQEFRLMEIAAYDELTGLRNRRESMRIFDKQLEAAHRSEKDMSIAMFDLDFFKTINDQHGHLTGDFVLKSFANVLNKFLRKSDFIFRWGGEEFLLISVNTSLAEMKSVADKLRKKVENMTLSHNGQDIAITTSVGVACFPQHGKDQSELLLAADSALYKSKSNGRNCVSVPD
jgi:diguanylate cyclase (GGDEF)-like protein/PAS domain S-box-containing protein